MTTVNRRDFITSAAALMAVALSESELNGQKWPHDPFSKDMFMVSHLVGGDKVGMLCITNADVGFYLGSWGKRSTVFDQAKEVFVKELTVECFNRIWRHDGQHIRAHRYGGGPLLTHSGVDVHGYYLTTDYSVMPPRLVLTPKPTEWSLWEITPVEGKEHQFSNPRVGAKYVRQLNGRGVDAWLAVSKSSYGCYVENHLTQFARAELSFDAKAQFHWRSYRPDDTSK